MVDQLTEEGLKEMIYDCASMDIFSKCFSVEKSQLRLTEDETSARIEWNQKREELLLMSDKVALHQPRSTNLSQFLSSVLLPPELSTNPKETASRSKADEQRKHRHYPPELLPYEMGLVQGTEPGSSPLQNPVSSPLNASINFDMIACNENNEQNFLLGTLWGKFRKASLMLKSEAGDNKGVLGLPDEKDLSADGANLTMMIEMRSSHNLLLPNEFEKLKEEYEESFQAQNTNRTTSRPTKRSHICHPLAQLFAYMIDNSVRFGVLLSVSKAYFCFFDGTDSRIDRVRVSGACLTVDRNYLKRWAWFIQESRKDEYKVPDKFKISDLVRDMSWLEGTPIDGTANVQPVASTTASSEKRNRDDDNDDDDDPTGGRSNNVLGRAQKKNKINAPETGKNIERNSKEPSQQKKGKTSSRKSNAENISEKTNSNAADSSPNSIGSDGSIPHSVTSRSVDDDMKYEFETKFIEKTNIPFVDLSEIGQVLGRGRNGDVFEADFEGKKVAVKQFDLFKNFESYEKELEGYLYLQEAWGELVLEPQFIGASLSGMVRFLGLPKGVRFSDDEAVFVQQEKQLAEIHERLGSQYNFRHLDSSCENGIVVDDKVFAIDLEEWEKVENLEGAEEVEELKL